MELAKKIISLNGSKSKIIFSNRKMGDMKHTLADIGKAKKLLGYNPKRILKNPRKHRNIPQKYIKDGKERGVNQNPPKYKLDEGLKLFIEWVKKNGIS